MVALDFSKSTEICFDWVKKTLKPNDYCLLTNVLFLKPAGIIYIS